MKIKVSELTGAALDWAVAKCEGQTDSLTIVDNKISGVIELWWNEDVYQSPTLNEDGTPRYFVGGVPVGLFGCPASIEYSTDWGLGGPIIDREGYEIHNGANGQRVAHGDRQKYGFGETSLIASMRLLVRLRLGEEIEIPDELLN